MLQARPSIDRFSEIFDIRFGWNDLYNPQQIYFYT